jgi:hypothetical protein
MPSATMRAHLNGMTDAPPTTELTPDRPRLVTQQHLRALGVPEDKIDRFASMPDNAPRCFTAFANMCRSFHTLSHAILQMRSACSRGLEDEVCGSPV